MQMATIELVSSTVSAPAWFDATPVKQINRRRWNHFRGMSRSSSVVDSEARNDGSKAYDDRPAVHMPLSIQKESTECIDNIQDGTCDDFPDERDPRECQDNSLGEQVDDVSTRQEESIASGVQPLTDTTSLNELGSNYSYDVTDTEISQSASFTTLSALSLITPPPQWIPKDSFLYRRKKFEQWGIPLAPEMKKTTAQRLQPRYKAMAREQYMLEQILQERLVWIKYQHKYWWPAIVYDNYRQLLDDETLMEHVWYRIPLFWQRLHLAVAVVFHPQDPRNQMPVARVLGRGTAHGTDTHGTIEVVEVKVEDIWPFNDEGKMALILKEMALNGDFFRDHPSLYLDWHRGMDEMEQLLRECLGVGADHSEEEVSGSSDPLAVKQAQWKERYRQKKQAKAVAATLTAIAESAPNHHHEHDGALDDNSLLDASIVNSTSPYESSQHPAKSSPMVKKGKRTWLQRAKDAERKQLVAKCHACSTHVLDGVESICAWKDNLVAAALEQPTRVASHAPSSVVPKTGG